MELKLEISQKQTLKLSREMKISFEILSMPYSQLLKFWSSQSEKNYSSVDKSFLENISQEQNFYDYLEEQIIYFEISDRIKENLIYCINNLDSHGFLELSDLELCQQLKISKKELEETYKYLWELEPTGVGTHNFKECIKLQLIKKEMWEEEIGSILDNLSYIAQGKEKDLAEKINLSISKIEFYLSRIKTCNPKPTRGFSTNKVFTIIPDFYLYIKNSKIIIEENSSWRNTFYNKKNTYDKNLELLKYCIEKRIETTKKILYYIIKKQENYFIKGDFLKTLHEKEVAEHLDLNISTISRAIQNKYIWTEKGIISFKSLFCYFEGKERIKEKLLSILEIEDKKRPFSDLQLAKKIEKDLKYPIARRTIAKYREELGYLSSRKRKII